MSPRYAMLRSIARLLAMQQDAQLRGGESGEAIETARLAMRLGQAAQDGPLIAGLVGLAIRALPISTFGRHVDRLDAADAGRLLSVCRDWLREPDPFPGMLAAEQRSSRRLVRMHFAEVPGVEAALDRVFDRARAEWKKPAWERGRVEDPSDQSLEGRIVAPVAGPLEHAADLFTRDRAQIRLLAVHAGVRGYRLEHGKLPERLTELKLGDLAEDPFTGKPFRYSTGGDRARLTSAGPRAEPGDARAVEGRRPVSVAPEK